MTCEISPKVPECVIGDAVRLGELLSPLLNNACKFTPRGRVDVSASVVSGGDDDLRLRVEVRDTGIGIAPERIPAIFESFRQIENGLSRSYPGLGLGLAVARKLAAKMGGDVSVESEPEAGSTFRVEIPLRLPQPAADGGGGAGVAAEADRPRILLVEDNEVARRIVTHMLERADYDVQCATGGREGIHAASDDGCDLILMDIQMPDVNGLEAAAAIRKLPGHGSTPIIALSANFSDEFRHHCREAGFQGFIPKPIRREDLLRAIERHLNK
jgi:CheY-like chemotaxis protein